MSTAEWLVVAVGSFLVVIGIVTSITGYLLWRVFALRNPGERPFNWRVWIPFGLGAKFYYEWLDREYPHIKWRRHSTS